MKARQLAVKESIALYMSVLKIKIALQGIAINLIILGSVLIRLVIQMHLKGRHSCALGINANHQTTALVVHAILVVCAL
jgi:hypothetical protein